MLCRHPGEGGGGMRTWASLPVSTPCNHSAWKLVKVGVQAISGLPLPAARFLEATEGNGSQCHSRLATPLVCGSRAVGGGASKGEGQTSQRTARKTPWEGASQETGSSPSSPWLTLFNGSCGFGEKGQNQMSPSKRRFLKRPEREGREGQNSSTEIVGDPAET